MQREDVKAVISETVKETFDNKYQLTKGTKEEILEKEKLIIKDLSSTLDLKEEDAVTIVKGATEVVKEKEMETVVANISKQNSPTASTSENQTASFDESALIAKLKKSEREKEELQSKIQALQAKVQSDQESHKKILQIRDQAHTETEAKLSQDQQLKEEVERHSNIPDTNLDDNQRTQMITDLRAGKQLSADQAANISEALEREQKVIELAKKAELDLKRQKIESEQKEALFKSEFSKMERVLKSKDIILNKAKESMKKLVERKEIQVEELRRKVEDLNKNNDLEQITSLKNQVMSANQEKNGLERSLEVYKQKISVLSQQIDDNKKNDNSKALAEQNRALARHKTQLENQLRHEEKQKKNLEDRFNQAKESENKFRTTSMQLEKALRESQGNLKILKENQSKMSAQMQQSQQNDDKKLQAELRMQQEKNNLLTSRIKEYELKMKELQQKIVDSSSQAQAGTKDAKSGQLDQANKQLAQDLAKAKTMVAEAKKDAMKFKSETVALQNKIKTLQREVEKYKKVGGKKAA
jgi:hypothetical protein